MFTEGMKNVLLMSDSPVWAESATPIQRDAHSIDPSLTQ
jgi:hypothetical protein